MAQAEIGLGHRAKIFFFFFENLILFENSNNCIVRLIPFEPCLFAIY